MTENIIIAIPSMAPGGMEAEMSAHFGHADTFTLVEITGKDIVSTAVISNPPHIQGGCMAPVHMLKENRVDAIIVGGLGAKPLMGFRQNGIRVLAGASGSVGSAVNEYLAGNLKLAGDDIICGHTKTDECHH
ncbi:MAG: NifB/NifX family molybdenum-iron cluster-binding protein [Candidatus Thermoplasmatota archaeon]|nr:dinitrogenase iron-molybdenum cofactor biosynthesis protein [Euryarchaeota archaeon]MBU4032572.1 NifB/NifX family molybdenum-iron cluster-binding protein [Candidatus Thermoplasmatota archaeon]MBU4070575.1 NifB/NifX family molybdenum-iron cluster-binding protein [Candidatus Thermoplasmatota archaeon]MBU4144142.1 NifB/NifX family molybdenum-iron cluster-binding protein [Candidatus Thermoplasmatota archaeon]MBU4591170.1 NifB/NifX family molybdenum-iron cluster-binding protein [Candidatus Thermo